MNRAAVANMLVRTNAFAPFRFLNRNKLLILMYHRFSETEEFGKTSVKTFERHLEYLTRHYSVLPMSEAVTRMKNGDSFPPRSAVITIDDGYQDFFDAAFPVLQKFNFPATIYIVTEFVNQKCWIWTDKARYLLINGEKDRLEFKIDSKVFDPKLSDRTSRLAAAGSVNSELKKLPDEEKNTVLHELGRKMGVEIPEVPVLEFSALNWDEVRELAKAGIEVGSHTAAHPILTNVDADRLKRELSVSKVAIEENLQREAPHFCYPNGNVSAREREAVAAAGYGSAVTTELRLCDKEADPFLLPRIDAEPELHRFVQSTSGFDRLKHRENR
jgi:peptidoglycan/xylan/chitin deacetylase (PgdA/CDA1 family)